MIESPSLPPRAELQSDPLPLPGRPSGRVARSVAGYALLVALMFVTPMLVFVPAALFHCAIRNGRRAAWIVLVIAVAIAAAYLQIAPASSPTVEKTAWSFLAGLVFAVALPSMAAIPMVERGEAFGRVLMFLVIGAAIGLGLTEAGSRAMAGFSPYAAQVAQVKQSTIELARFYRANGMPEAVPLLERLSGYGTVLLPAMLLAQLAFAFVLSLLMLGRLKAWREHAARRDPDAPRAYLFRNLTLPDWLLFGFVLGGLTPLATGMLQHVAANLLTIVVFLYVLQGLAIFRFMLVAIGAGFAGTMLGWTLLAFLLFTGGAGFLLLGLAGLFDPFFDFRHFKKRKDDSHESHSD